MVTVEKRGSVAIVSINRPEKLNAINKAVAVELQRAFTDFDRSAQRVAILTGVGCGITGGMIAGSPTPSRTRSRWR